MGSFGDSLPNPLAQCMRDYRLSQGRIQGRLEFQGQTPGHLKLVGAGRASRYMGFYLLALFSRKLPIKVGLDRSGHMFSEHEAPPATLAWSNLFR